MKRILATYFICMVAGLCASAQNESFQSIRFEKEPAVAALAGAGIASDKAVAYSAFRNAAVLPFYEGNGDITASYSMWSPSDLKANDINIGCGLKAGERFGYSVAVTRRGGATYDIIDDMGNAGGTFQTSTMMIAGGAGYKVADCFSVGLNLKYLTENLASDYKPSSFGTDIFAMYKQGGLNVAAGLSAVGSSIKDLAGNAYKLPMSLTAGLSYTIKTEEKSAVELDAAMDYFFSGNFTAAAGAQYIWNDIFAIRAGYHFGSETAAVPSYASFGAGFNIHGIHLDIAYITANPVIGGSLNLGLGYKF